METEASFTHVIRAHGMRTFYSKLLFLDPRGVAWTSWVMAVGRDPIAPMFCHAFLYTEQDPRLTVGQELLAVKQVFKDWILSYYQGLQTH